MFNTTNQWNVTKHRECDYTVHNGDPKQSTYFFKTLEWADLCVKRLNSLDFPNVVTYWANDKSMLSQFATGPIMSSVVSKCLVFGEYESSSEVRLFHNHLIIKLPVKRKSIRGFFVNCFFKLVFDAKLEDNNHG